MRCAFKIEREMTFFVLDIKREGDITPSLFLQQAYFIIDARKHEEHPWPCIHPSSKEQLSETDGRDAETLEASVLDATCQYRLISSKNK